MAAAARETPATNLLREEISLANVKLAAVTGLFPTVADGSQTHSALTTSRGAHLDAQSLDEEIVRTLRLQADKVAQTLGHPELARFGPEIDALLRLVLWGATVRVNVSTPGQRLQNLRYRNEAAFALPHLGGVLTLPVRPRPLFGPPLTNGLHNRATIQHVHSAWPTWPWSC